MSTSDLRLAFVTEVLHLDFLHFGYWEEGDALTFENMAKAQRRYTDKLFSFIPPGVKTILDVGCGTGATARLLQEKGYQVVCLSPDPFQRDYIAKTYGNKIEFHLSRFEVFPTDRKFDLILCSESFQYLAMPDAFIQARKLLNPGGHLLVSDYFRNPGAKTMKMSHPFEDVMRHAAAQSFRVEKQEDITSRVTPTLDWGREFYGGRVLPAIRILTELLRRKFPRLLKATSLIGGKKLAKIVDFLHHEGPSQLDSAAFAREIRYVICLFGS